LVFAFDFRQAVPFIASIPRGSWSGYQDVAAAAGNAKGAPGGRQSPARQWRDHRQLLGIHSDGSVADGFIAHAPGRPDDPVSARDLLASEGVRFDRNGCADHAQRFFYEDCDGSRKPMSAAQRSSAAEAAHAAAAEHERAVVADVSARRIAKGKPALTAAQQEDMLARLAAERAAGAG
jgi:hypothetical protein